MAATGSFGLSSYYCSWDLEPKRHLVGRILEPFIIDLIYLLDDVYSMGIILFITIFIKMTDI